MSVPVPPATPPGPYDEVKAAKIAQAMKTLKAALTSLDPQLLGDFPADLAFFQMVQARATSIENEVVALRRRRAKLARLDDVTGILDQTRVDFEEATEMANALQLPDRTAKTQEVADLRDNLTGFISNMP